MAANPKPKRNRRAVNVLASIAPQQLVCAVTGYNPTGVSLSFYKASVPSVGDAIISLEQVIVTMGPDPQISIAALGQVASSMTLSDDGTELDVVFVGTVVAGNVINFLDNAGSIRGPFGEWVGPMSSILF